MDGAAVPGSGKKEQDFTCDLASVSDHVANSKMCPLSLTRCGESGGEDDGGRSDVRYTYGLGERNNMNTDSRRTDSSGRTGAPSIHRDSNSDTSDRRSSRSETQN